MSTIINLQPVTNFSTLFSAVKKIPLRRQPRRVSRELTLLSLSQVSSKPENLAQKKLDELVIAAIRTLTAEVQDVLEMAAAEVQRGNERILSSETRASNVQSARAMVEEAIELTQNAINRLGTAVNLPEFIQLANQYEVREYALEILGTIKRRRLEIDQQIENGLVDWQINRLPQIDLDILRIAVAEIMFLKIPDRVAINEAVELAKQYSDEEGHRFINGVMRRVTNQIKAQSQV